MTQNTLTLGLTFATSLAPSTAFLTVTLTPKVPDWLSPGNYDPIMAFQFSQVALVAIDRSIILADRIKLRRRAERLLQQGERMVPRGSRVAWWEDPNLSEQAHGTSSGTASIGLAKPVASGTNTATSRRRRRS